ncbi:MAG TPA: flagellar motor protein [Dehalococcoidia bacterium]|nr:flagellar motor protein [Dehalococcoidia bacterium]
MDLVTVIGFAVAFIGIIGGFTIEGGSIAGLINLPGFLIVVVGTLGATMISFPLEKIIAIPKLYMSALFNKLSVHAQHMGNELVEMAGKARREGLLSLEDDVSNIDDAFAKKGMMLMIDGTDPDALRSIMEIDIDAVAARHRENAKVFEAGGGFAPTLGVLGAVMGLITVLGHLGGPPEELGHGIATAFVATFYGVGMANVILLPIAEKLKVRSQEERMVREMILEGIMSIQAGDNPRIVREKLNSFLSPSERDDGDGDDAPPDAGAAPAADAA